MATEQTVNILDVNVNFGNLVTETAKVKNELGKLKKELDELKNAEEEDTEAIIRKEAELRNQQRVLRENQKLLEQLTAIQKEEIKTVDDGRKALSIVSKLWAEQAALYGENSEEAQKLAATKLELTERLKELEKATGDNRRNVGNYIGALKEGAKGVTGFGDNIMGLSDTLNKSPWTFIINLVFKFVKAILEGEKVTKALNRVIQPLNTAFNAVVAVLQKALLPALRDMMAIGGGLVKFLTGDFKNGIAEMRQGFEDLKNSAANAKNEMANIGDVVKEGLARGGRIAQLTEEIEKLDATASKEEANRRKAIEQNKLLATEENRTLGARIDLLNEASRLELESEQARVKVVSKRLELAKLQAKDSKNQIETQREIAELEAEMINISAGRFTREKELSTQIQGLRNQERAKIEAEKKAEQDKAIKDVEDRLKLYELANKTRITDETKLTDELIAEEMKRQNSIANLQKELIDLQKQYGRITATEAKLLKDAIDTSLSDNNIALKGRQAKEAIEELQNVILSARLRLEQGRNEEGVLLTPEGVKREKELLNDLLQTELTELEERRKQGIVSEEAYQLEKFEIEKAYKLEQAALDIQLEDEKTQRQIFQADAEFELRKQQGIDKFDLMREELEREKAERIKIAEEIGADVSSINAYYSLKNQEIDKMEAQSRLELASQYLGAISGMIGQNTAFGKIAATATAGVNTWLSAQEAFRSQLVPSDPTSLPRAIAGAAIAAAAGLANIVKINKVQVPTPPQKRNIPKLAKGGVVGGDLHSNGGTKYYGEDGNVIEMERGERMFVLNRNASAAISGLSYLNQIHGGNSFINKPSRYLRDGGMADTLTGVTIPNDQPIYVDVKDIINETNRRVEVVDGGNLS